MSSLWTPDGERPIRREPSTPTASAAPTGQPVGREGFDDGFDLDDEDLRAQFGGRQPTREEMAAMQEELRAMTAELVSVPASAVIANHCIGFFQLAAAHLQVMPPKLAEAQLAIDAMAAVLDGLKGRLGPDESTLHDALAQIRLAFVQVKAST